MGQCLITACLCGGSHDDSERGPLRSRDARDTHTPATALLRLRCSNSGWHQRRTAGILLKSHLDFHALLMFPELGEARAITFPSFPIGSPIQHLSVTLSLSYSPRASFRQKAMQLTGMSLSLLLLECKSPANKVFLDALDGNRGERQNAGMGGWGREQRGKT